MSKSIVRLMHYDPRWRQEFLQTRSSILQSCLGWVTAVEHIGSTAISGLIARPTIDLLAGIASEHTTLQSVADHDMTAQAFAESVRMIEGLNYKRSEVPCEWDDRCVVLEKNRSDRDRPTEPTHRIFLMPRDSSAWKKAVRIRDRLNSDRELAIRFEETKVARWRRGEGDPGRYKSDKAVFFTHLLDQSDVSF